MVLAAPPRHHRTPSTCRPARRSRSRWSGARTSRNAVALNSAMFNASRDRSAPRSPACTIGAFDICDRVPDQRRQLPRGDRRPTWRCATSELRQAPAIARPTIGRAAVFASWPRAWRYVRRTPLVLLAITIVGLVATFGMNFQVRDPAARRRRPPRRTRPATASSWRRPGSARLVAALYIAFQRNARRRRSSLGAIAARASARSSLGALEVVRAVAARDVLRRGAAAIAHGGHREHDDPARGPGPSARPGDERLHDGLRGIHAGRRPPDGLDRLALRRGRRR